MGSKTMCQLVQGFAPSQLQTSRPTAAIVRLLGRLLSLIWLAECGWANTTAPPKALASPRPNILLITLDTTRADRMGFLGSERGLTPNLDALARQSAVFSRAYAQVPLTTPSHATILTGTYPQFSHVNYMGDPLGKTLPFLPDILHKNGYRTAAFVGALVLDPKKLAQGFDRGFDIYDAGFHRRRPNEDHYGSLERRGEEVVSRALAWLSKKPAGPFFLWVHLYDPHDPYSPPEPYKTRYQAEPYDGEIAYTDSVVAKLIAGLRTRSLFDGALIAVMADHGEAFGEHGEKHHGIFLYDETIHVPLLLKLPGQHSAKKVASRVGLIDVAPTILQAAALSVPSAMQGESLLSLTKSNQTGAPDEPNYSNSVRSVYAESSYGHLSFGWSKLQAWRTGRYLYVEAPERELYDQSVDEPAAHNLAPDSKAIVETASAQVTEFYRKTKGDAPEKNRLNLDQTESLHALGYMGSDSGSSSKSDNEGGADPKQKIAVANLLYDALVDMENDRFQEAVPILEQVLQQEPNTPIAFLQLGRAYMSLREYQKAVTPLANLVEKKPDDAFARYELGCALVKTGRWEEAAPHFEAAVSQMTGSAMMHFYLALVYQRTSRVPNAAKEFQSALRVDPNHFPANLLLGRLLVEQQRAAEALPYLRKAAKLRPDSIDAHGFLSNAYRELGQEANASRELSEAERIKSEGGSRLGTPTGDSAGDSQP
jgi:arylsulfatase A-like enzyme/lipopolysaccharide biosynthesis regulator YciM